MEEDTIVEVQEKESESENEEKLEDDLKPMVDKTEQEEILSDDMNELQVKFSFLIEMNHVGEKKPNVGFIVSDGISCYCFSKTIIDRD